MIFVIFVSLFLLCNYFITKTNHYKNIYIQFDKFDGVPGKLDIVNIGSGPSYYNFKWDAIKGVRGYNLALAPEDFRYDFRVLERYIHNLKIGGVVVVVVCPLSFGENEYLEKAGFSEKYAKILSWNKVDVSLFRYLVNKYFPLIRHIKHFASFLSNESIIDPYAKEDSIKNDEERKNNADNIYKGWLSENAYLKDMKDPSTSVYYKEVFNKRKKELKKIIDFIIECRMTPVIVIPPLSEYLREYFSKQFLREFFYNNIDFLYEKNIMVLDYLEDDRFSDLSLYSNGIFLQNDNRDYFTKVVYDTIKERYGD